MRIAPPVVVLTFLLIGACARKPEAPSVELTDVGYALHLPAPMQQALDSVAPGFRPVRANSFRSDVSQSAVITAGAATALFAAVGDFDHDGITDAVVEGTTPSDSALQVIAILNGAKPRAVPVTEFSSYDADAVGIYLASAPADSAGAFEVVDYPDSTLVYRYSQGAFEGSRVGN